MCPKRADPTMSQINPTDVLSPEIFARIKAIQIRTQRLVTDALAGDYESAFKGRGMEFEEVRAYIPGDDVRHIDWKVTARTSIPHVKVHREERELTVMLLVDVSSSGAFGSVNQFKNNDRVGLIIFSDRIEHFVPPKKGRAHVWMVIRDILNFKPERRTTDLDGAIEYMGKVIKHRSVAFVISDFIDHEVSQRLRAASKKHDITAISISDPREMALPPVGIIELEDAETGETIVVDTRDKNTREGFRILTRDDRRDLQEGFRRTGIGQIDLRTDKGYIDPIVRFFRSREGHR